MRGKLRLLILAIGGGGAVVWALTYNQRLDKTLRGTSGDRFDYILTVPEGQPRQAALTFVYYVALQGNQSGRITPDLARAMRQAGWGESLPTRDQFDELIATAADTCGVSRRQWMRDLEYYGGLHGGLRSGFILGSLEPFRQASAVTGGSITGGGTLYLLAVEPALCAGAGPRWGITYAGDLVQLTPEDAAMGALLKRTDAVCGNLKAFERGAVHVLGPLASHEDRWVRRETVQAMARAGKPAAAPYLVPLLEDADTEVQYLAALALAELGDRRAEPYLRSLLGDDEQFLQFGFAHYRAVLALGKLGFGDVRGELELMADWHSAELFPDEAKRVLRRLNARSS